MMNVKRTIALTLVSLLIILAGCAQPAGKPVLRVLNWQSYGSDDPEAVAVFEAANNCVVEHIAMQSEDDLLTKLRTGGKGELDVVLPNPSVLPKAIEEGLLLELDTAKLTNYGKLDATLKDLPENKKGESVYAVPWVWGSTAIAYHTERASRPTSIKALFDPAYEGRIAIRDDYNDAVMIAALALGQDANHPSDLDAIKRLLTEQKPLNKTYWETAEEFHQLFSAGQVDIALMWSGEAASMIKDGQPIAYVVPEDGAIGWVDYWGICAKSQNTDLAYKFVDYMISKEFQAAWFEKGGNAPANTEAAAAASQEDIAAAALTDADRARLSFIAYHDDAERTVWHELWLEVKASK